MKFRPEKMNKILCSKCRKTIKRALHAYYRPIYDVNGGLERYHFLGNDHSYDPDLTKKCRGGHYIAYCSEYCMKQHNHEFHHYKGLLNQIKKLRRLNKKYLTYLSFHGHSQT